MFSDNNLIRQMAPLLKRVLIVDPNVAASRLINEVMRDSLQSQVWTATTTERALKLSNNVNPDLIFVEYLAPGLDGLDFTRALRKSRYACRKAPVVMLTSQPTAASIVAARDAGVHEVLCKPFSLKELTRRLEAVTLRPRDWVEAMSYIGPDRRRFNSGLYAGPRKRRCDAAPLSDRERIEQALKILRSAVIGAATDPAQAVRSMLAQAEELKRMATQTANSRLAHAVRDFQAYLDTIALNSGAIDLARLEGHAEPLLRFLPRDDGIVAA